MRLHRYYPLAAFLLLTTAATAQRRLTAGTLLVPEAQTELALKGDNYLLLGVRGQVRNDNTTDPLEQLGLHVGYEQFWNERWSGGATLRSDFYSSYRNGGDVSRLQANITPELFVRHWNTLGEFNFRQRLGVEYFIPTEEGAESRPLTRLRLDLDRVFALGENLALRPRLAYEATAYLRLQRDETQQKERFVDFGALRAEIGVRVSPHVDFTPWVASQTAYINAIPQYDGQGNQTSGGQTNIRTPVVGLDVRFTIFKGGAVFERRQLPTQH